ncbi:hypothetical protein [Capsulimonas corticalis]|nr:hypothetical protein [Capsulimonas corticalis]
MARSTVDTKSRDFRCPQCKTPMANMGKDFKAPRQADVKQWQKVEQLYNNGYIFSSCGCGGSGDRPATLQEVQPFLAEQKRLKAEWIRQAVIQKRAVELSEKRTQRARLLHKKRLASVKRTVNWDEVIHAKAGN